MNPFQELPTGFPGGAMVAPKLPGAAGGPAVGVEPKVLRVPLATVAASGTTRLTVDVAARVAHPSRRLSCYMSIGFEPTAALGITPNVQTSTWVIRAMRPGTRNGRESFLHEVKAASALPDGYEVDSAVRMFLVTATLKIPLDGAGAAIPGTWVLQAEWEPSLDLCQEDLDQQLARAEAQLVTAPAGPLAP